MIKKIIRTIKILKNEYIEEMYPFRKDPCKYCLKKPACNKMIKELICFDFNSFERYKSPFKNVIYIRLILFFNHVLAAVATYGIYRNIIDKFG